MTDSTEKKSVSSASSASDRTRAWVGFMVLVSLLLVAQPLVSLAQFTWPPLPGEPGWRYGLFGTLAESVHLVVLGLVVALLASHVANHPTAKLVSRVAAGLVGAVFFVSLLLFLAAAFAWVVDIPSEAHASFWRETIVSGLSLGIGAALSGVFAYWHWKS